MTQTSLPQTRSLSVLFRSQSRGLWFTLLLALTLLSQSALAWEAGFQRADLLTKKNLNDKHPVYLAGYGLFGNREAKGILDPVYIDSLYLKSGSTELIFIAMDVVGFSQSFGEKLRIRLSEELSMPLENILISATHTHSSIDLQGLWGGVSHQQREAILERAAQSAIDAYGKRQPVTVSLAVSKTGKGFNRRTRNSWIIPQITTLKVLDKNKSPLALLFSFGSHPVVLGQDNLSASADWVGESRRIIEKQQQAPALFINGVLGDVVPSLDGLPSKQRNIEFVHQYGTAIANSVLESLNKATPLNSSLKYCSERLTIKSDNFPLIFLTKILRQGTVNWFSPGSLSFSTQTSVIVMDSLVLMTTPGEPITLLGKELLSKVSGRPSAVLSLTHDSLGYLIPKEEYGREGAYEEKFAISRSLGQEVSSSIDKLLTECINP